MDQSLIVPDETLHTWHIIRREIICAKIDNNQIRLILLKGIAHRIVSVKYLIMTCKHINCGFILFIAIVADYALSRMSYKHIISVKVVSNKASVRIVAVLCLQLKRIFRPVTLNPKAACIRVAIKFNKSLALSGREELPSRFTGKAVNRSLAILSLGTLLQAEGVTPRPQTTVKNHSLRRGAFHQNFLHDTSINHYIKIGLAVYGNFDTDGTARVISFQISTHPIETD